jgi:cell wall-associated NlpC family hydrolase
MTSFKKIAVYGCTAAVCVLTACVPPQRYDEGTRSNARVSSGEKTVRIGIVRTAKRQIGVPYKMGGLTPRGFDCSGLTMFSYRKNGLRIPRTASQQYRFGRQVVLRDARPGDLVFFNTSGRRISHVGLYVGKGVFVHAPSSGSTVREDTLKNPYWRTHFRGAARYIR